MSMQGASRVETREAEPKARTVVGTPTAIAAAVGVTERGPIGRPIPCDSFEEYQATFGGFTEDSDLALAASTFFPAGGGRLWVSRTVHYADLTDPDSATATRASGALLADAGTVDTSAGFIIGAGPWFVEDGDELAIAVDGGAEQVATLEAKRAEATSVATFPTGFSGGETLEVEVGDFGSSVTFDAADQSPEQVALRVNDHLRFAAAIVLGEQVMIRTDLGGSDIRLRIIGGDANDTLNFPTTAASGSGNVGDQSVVLARELQWLVDGLSDLHTDTDALTGGFRVRTTSAGAGSTLTIRTTRLSALLGLPPSAQGGSAPAAGATLTVEGKDRGSYADRIDVEIETSDEPGSVNLNVIEDGVHRETFLRLVMDAAHDRYAPSVVNAARGGSAFIRLHDAELAGAPLPAVQTITLSGGNDGLVGLDDGDFIGSETGATGLYAFDKVDEVSTLVVPGRATPATHHAMAYYAEHHRKGRMFCVFEPPAESSAQDVREYVTKVAKLSGVVEYAAMYWPRLKLRNPKASVFGQGEAVVAPVSGFIAGKYAHNDRKRRGGVHKSPAGVEVGRLPGVLGFETDEVLDDRKRGLVFDALVNPLTSDSQYPPYIDGARTLMRSGNFPFVGERRGVNFIKTSIGRALEYTRHQDNTEELRAGIERTIEGFLVGQMKVGAFASPLQEDAFFIEFPVALNTPTVIFVRVGLATNKPAEFIIIEFSQAAGRGAA